MREIKFRAWDKDAKEWVDFSGFQDFAWAKSRIEQNRLVIHRGLSDTDNFEIMQFTGLKDKNGKEIYEGDILDVKFNNPYIERVYWKGEPDARAIVIWDFAGFRLKCKGKEDDRYADWADTDGYFDPILDMEKSQSEIIGNIYENQELLTN